MAERAATVDLCRATLHTFNASICSAFLRTIKNIVSGPTFFAGPPSSALPRRACQEVAIGATRELHPTMIKMQSGLSSLMCSPKLTTTPPPRKSWLRLATLACSYRLMAVLEEIEA